MLTFKGTGPFRAIGVGDTPSTNFDLFRYASYGLPGVASGSLSSPSAQRGHGIQSALPSKESGVRLAQGEVVHIKTGCGNPALRPRASIRVDLVERLCIALATFALNGYVAERQV